MTVHLDSIVGQLPERLLEALRRVGHAKLFRSKELIHAKGDPSHSFLIVEQGKVLVSIDDCHGNRVEAATYRKGQSFGFLSLLAAGKRTHDAIAIGNTKIVEISKSDFDRLIDQDSAFRNFVLTTLSQRLIRTLELLDDERRFPLIIRVAKQVLRREKMATLQQSTQASLAEELGVSRYAYGKAISKLKEFGLITTAYRKLSIKDKDALLDWIENPMAGEEDVNT